MSINYEELLGMYDQVEAAPVQANTVLPAGWYPLKVEKVLDRQVNEKSGVPRARLQLRVIDGEYANRVVFADKYLASSPYKRDGQGGEVERTKEERAAANNTIGAQMQQFIKALGVTKGTPFGNGADKLFGYWNVDSWEGMEFMGRVRVQKGTEGREDRNDLGDAAHMNDPKYGIEKWKSKKAAGSAATAGAVRL